MSVREEIYKESYDILTLKGSQYGETFHNVPNMLKILFKHTIDPTTGKYQLSEADIDSILVMARVLDKIQRVAVGNQGDESAWMDILGYSVLEEEKVRAKKMMETQGGSK